MTAVAPRATAMLTATVMPRSLNDPVGLAPSTFRYTSHPVRADTTGAGSRGVAPSPSVITGAPAAAGSRSRYCLITPGQLTRLMATLAVRRAGGAPASTSLWSRRRRASRRGGRRVLGAGALQRRCGLRPGAGGPGRALAGSLVVLPFHAHHAGDRAHHVHR